MSEIPQYIAAELATMFNVTEQTIRHWSEEFKEYLLPRANPGKKRTRSYTEDDLAVLALVARMKSMGHVYEDIHMALANGQRGEVPDFEEADLRRNKLEERIRQLQTTAEKEIAIANERTRAALEKAAEMEARAQQAEVDRSLWQQRAVEAQDRLSEVQQILHAKEVEIARIQGELEVVERDRQQIDHYREQLNYYRLQIERLETERAELTKELMSIYRRMSAIEMQHDEKPPKVDESE